MRWLRTLNREDAREVGAAMRARALRDHTYSLRAQQVDAILSASRVPQLVRAS